MITRHISDVFSEFKGGIVLSKGVSYRTIELHTQDTGYGERAFFIRCTDGTSLWCGADSEAKGVERNGRFYIDDGRLILRKRKSSRKKVAGVDYEGFFPKRHPRKGERLCPYDGIAYRMVPGYESSRGCPVCKAIAEFHLPVSKEVADKFPRGVKKRIVTQEDK
ncbi:MAG: hypothetical protein V4690_01130 [Patescibacteria group bacterium]